MENIKTNTLINKYKTKENLYKITEKAFNKNKTGKKLLNRYGLDGAINKLKVIRMINEYYPKRIPKSRVDKQLFVKVGRYFEDGFSGINISNRGGGFTTGRYYLIQILDGENGVQFAELYDDMPTPDRLKDDALYYPFK